MRARGNLVVHDRAPHYVGRERVEQIKRGMARPKAHPSVVIKNHVTGARLKVELVDLPFQEGRRFRVRVNGGWARKVPVARQVCLGW